MNRLKQNDSEKMNERLPLDEWEERTTRASELWKLEDSVPELSAMV